MMDRKAQCAVDVVEQLCALMRQVEVHGVEHATSQESAARLREAIAASMPPLSLQFFPDAVLCDRRLLAVGVDAYRRWQRLISPLIRLSAQEVVIEALPEAEGLLAFVQTLATVARKGRSPLPRIPGLRFSAVRRATTAGRSTDHAALETFLAGEVVKLCQQTADLASPANTSWSWPSGRAVAWRLERCLSASVSATGGVIESGPFPWSGARRVIAAAFRVGAVLSRLRVSPLTQRAAVHAMLAVGCAGFRARAGIALHEAASAALPAMLAADGQHDGEPDPHRLRTCAIITGLTQPDPRAYTLQILPLLHACYEIERQRWPADAQIMLSTIDLQAWLAAALGQQVHAIWGRALLNVLGMVPAGSYVLAEGKLALVMGPNDKGDAWHPRVLVGGELTVPQQPVTLHSPLSMTPWAK